MNDADDADMKGRVSKEVSQQREGTRTIAHQSVVRMRKRCVSLQKNSFANSWKSIFPSLLAENKQRNNFMSVMHFVSATSKRY